MHACLAPGCSFVCTEAFYLRQHNRQHTGERPFSCTIDGCALQFASRSALSTHARRKHNLVPRPNHSRPDNRPFPCTVGACTAAFASAALLKKHVRLHNLPEHLACDEPGCGFKTRKLRALFSHTREAGHAGVQCPQPNCAMRFKYEASLNDHKSGPAHAGAGGRPLCKTCNLTFGTAAEYAEHCGHHRLQNLEKGRKGGAAARAAREILLQVELAGAGAPA